MDGSDLMRQDCIFLNRSENFLSIIRKYETVHVNRITCCGNCHSFEWQFLSFIDILDKIWVFFCISVSEKVKKMLVKVNYFHLLKKKHGLYYDLE